MNRLMVEREPMAEQHRTKLAVQSAGTGPTCCPAGLDQPMSRAAATDLARLFKAIAVPARLQILTLIRSSDTGELCACDFADSLGLSQPTISHHLKVLTDSGLLVRRQHGTWAHFSIDSRRLAELAAVVSPARDSAEVLG